MRFNTPSANGWQCILNARGRFFTVASTCRAIRHTG